MDNFVNDFVEAMQLLSNGAVITGHHPHTHKYRQTCLEHAYHTLSTCVVPELVSMGILPDFVSLTAIKDVGVLFQKKVISREQSLEDQ